MKNIVISRGKFEIARAALKKSSLLIGRSPTCDVVVRAPGVQPIHFLVEWVGVGEFNADIDNWIVFDISHAAGGDYSAEGLLIQTDKRVELGSFVFFLEKASFAQEMHLGGAIQKEISVAATASTTPVDKKLVELVWLRTDSGAIEDVSHFVPAKLTKKTLPVKKCPQFKFQMHPSNANLKLLFEDKNDIKVFSKGELLEKGQEELKLNDFLQVQWKKELFFLRFVDIVPSPVIERGRMDGLLFKISLASSALFTLLLLLTLIPPGPKEETPEAPRVARIEVRESVEAPPAPQPAPSLPIPTQLNKKVEPEPKKTKAGIKNLPSNKNPGRAAAPRVKSADGPPRMGLNSPAKSGDVNQVGILGVLNNKKAPKGPGVRADLIINQGVQADVLSGTQGNVVIKNPPAGVLGTGGGGDPRGSGKGTGNLVGASTTLRGAGQPDATSLGTIARNGGRPGSDLGTSLGGTGKGLGGGNERGSFDSGDLSVVGGLDKETVRRVIAAHRGKIRVCYDKALVANPKVAGRIVYRWLISPAGPVAQVSITRSVAGSPVLEQCVLGVVKSMVFPRAPNGMPTTVIYPFEFFARN